METSIAFLSQVLGRHVRDRDGRLLGRLADVAVRLDAGDPPRVSQLAIDSGGHRRLVVPAIGQWPLAGDVLRLRDPYVAGDPQDQPGSLYLKAQLLDREAIDLKRERVVRINDLLLADDDSGWILVAADVGARGLMRRLGLERLLVALGQSRALARAERILLWASVDPIETALACSDFTWSHDAIARLPPDEQARCIAGLQPGLRRSAASLLGLRQS